MSSFCLPLRRRLTYWSQCFHNTFHYKQIRCLLHWRYRSRPGSWYSSEDRSHQHTRCYLERSTGTSLFFVQWSSWHRLQRRGGWFQQSDISVQWGICSNRDTLYYYYKSHPLKIYLNSRLFFLEYPFELLTIALVRYRVQRMLGHHGGVSPVPSKT